MRSLSILFFLAICHYACAQKIEDYSLKHSMKQDGLSMQFTVLDPDKRGIKHHNSRKVYYWYKAQRVIRTQGGSSGQILHGLFESFYSSKQLCEKGNYSKGLKDGEWSYWRANGTLLRKESWKCGRQKGTQVFYDTKGDVHKTTVIRGRRSVSNSIDSLVEIRGKHRKITVYDTLGKTTSVARYKGQLLDGKQEIMTGDGSKTVTEYKNGELSEKQPSAKADKKEKDPKAVTGEEEKPGFFKKMKQRFTKKEKSEQPASDKQTGKKEKTDKREPKKEDPAQPEKEKKRFGLFKRKDA